jgi:hypothetical protein
MQAQLADAQLCPEAAPEAAARARAALRRSAPAGLGGLFDARESGEMWGVDSSPSRLGTPDEWRTASMGCV